jgi:hypothetical protein
MPRDEWRKATLQAEARSRKVKRMLKRRTMSARRAAAHTPLGKITKNGWNPNSKLWFGIHKDKAIKDIPESYLRWLVSAMKATGSWRVNALVAYLTEYLQPLTGKGVTR